MFDHSSLFVPSYNSTGPDLRCNDIVCILLGEAIPKEIRYFESRHRVWSMITNDCKARSFCSRRYAADLHALPRNFNYSA
jgi:hypothetical protein